MSNSEIKTFIETMGKFGDIWTTDQVTEVYGDFSLQDAIADRQAVHSKFADIISTVVNQ